MTRTLPIKGERDEADYKKHAEYGTTCTPATHQEARLDIWIPEVEKK